MDLSVALPLAYLTATGTAYNGTPGDTNWTKMLAYFIMDQLVWQNEPGGDWESLYNSGVLAGTITSTNIFTIPDGVNYISNKAHDFIYIICTNGNVSKFKTVPGAQLKSYNNVTQQQPGICSISSGQIQFAETFNSSMQEYGGKLYVPAFMNVTNFNLSPTPSLRGAVAVDDPLWLIYYAAAEWSQTDVTLIQNVPTLIAKATDRMNKMLLNNQRIQTRSQQTAPEGAARGDTMGLGEGY